MGLEGSLAETAEMSPAKHGFDAVSSTGDSLHRSCEDSSFYPSASRSVTRLTGCRSELP